MQEGYTVRQLVAQSPYSVSTLRRIIAMGLNRSPIHPGVPAKTDRYLIFDGTYLVRRIGLVAVMNADTHRIIRGQYGVTETPRGMIPFCATLHQAGLRPNSVTVDGNPHVIRAFRQVWPTIIIQRCLVHIQRQGLMWCRQDPKRPNAKKLRQIFLLVTRIRTAPERDHFLQQLASWEERYGEPIASSPETGWVLSDLQRARSMLLHALPDMFHYLEDRRIPPTTNGLEGYFARLKHRYRQHRGLAISKRDPYFQWYFHLCGH